MTATLIRNARVLRPGQGQVAKSLLIEGNRIARLDEAKPPAGTDEVDAGGRLLTPGLIDVHTHGIERSLYESGPEAMRTGLACLPKYGVTCVLPTMYKIMNRALLPKLVALNEALDDVDCVRVPGFHLEGPFLALPGAGADTLPGDVALLDEILKAIPGRVTVMSISPDTPNILPVIERLAREGINAFITHTRASVAQTEAAIAAGARHATHFYDVFHVPPEEIPGVRPVGAVETILADERVSVDFICDGVHVHPMAIKAALAAKGPENVMLITDANIGAGMPAGLYETTWGYPVMVRPGDGARIHDPGAKRHNDLAGSALTMDLGMTNLLRWLDLPEHDVWRMGTRSVAERMGITDVGDIRVGAMADLVLWDREQDGRLHAAKTWMDGRLVYDAKGVAREVTV